MSWTADEQSAVAKALLGSWPGTLAGWGRDAIAAYLGELEARGLTAERVLIAIRSWPAGSDFPPSAPNLAEAARRDPDAPTFPEMMLAVFGRGGVLRARTTVRKARWETGERDKLNEDAAWDRARELHPLIGSFVERQGLDRLRSIDLEDPEWGEARRRQLQAAWDEHVDVSDRREVAAVIGGRRRGELGAFDPARALGAPQIDRED